jgi:hypothetical protein
MARHEDEIARLTGEVRALQAGLAMAFGYVAAMLPDPTVQRENMARSLEAMLPDALAQAAADRSPAFASGIEHGIKEIARLTRLMRQREG